MSAIFFALFSILGHADLSFQVLAGGGLAYPSHEDTRIRTTMAVDAQLKWDLGVFAGLSYITTNAEESEGAFNVSMLSAVVGYQFAEYVQKIGIGLRLGLADVTTSTLVDNEITFVPSAWGIFVKRDWFLYEHFSVGMDFSFYAIGRDDTVEDGSRVVLTDFRLYALRGTAGFSF